MSRVESLDTSVPVVVLCPGYHGHAIARSLGQLGVAVYGIHSDARSPAARSRYWRRNFFWDLRLSPPDETIKCLLDVARGVGSRPILIPTDDESCLFVADHAETLREAFLMPEQPVGLARTLSNKQTLNDICARFAIPAPKTLFPQSRSDVEGFIDDLSFPVMLKGIDTKALRRRTGVSMVAVQNVGELLRSYDRLESPNNPSLMLQEYIPGGSEMVWMFNGYFDQKSDCLFGVTGKKLRQYPPHTGVTSLGICVSNEQVTERTTSFMAAIGYRGILDIGYKFDGRVAEYKLLDVNPRIGTTFRLFVDSAGIDVARALYRDLTGQPVPAGRAIEGRKWVVENFDLISSPTYIRDGTFTFRGWLGSYRGVREGAWFAVKDLRPFVAMAWRSLAVGVEKPTARVGRSWRMLHYRRSGRNLNMRAAEDLASGHHQERIDRHFGAEARYWKSLYQEESLYGVIHQQRRMRALRWLDGIGLPNGSRIADIGCGAGILTIDMAGRGHFVDGLDSSQAMIELACEVVAEAGLAERVRLQVGDAHDLPFPDGSFDCAISLGVLPYMRAPSLALSEIARVVKPGGYVVVNSDNLLRLNHLLDPRHTPVLAPLRRVARGVLIASGHPPQGLPSRRETSRSLQQLMEDAGLQIVSHQTLGFGPFSFLGWQPLSDHVGLSLHRRLQKAADRGVPILRATGSQALVLAQRGESGPQLS
jgi:D-aspartate ligase